MKLWQFPALLSGMIVAGALALASISYNGSLGTAAPAFDLLPISNRLLFQSLALAFDLGMTASVFAFWYWLPRSRVAAVLCAALFVIASLFSIHSVHGYIAINLTSTSAPAKREQDVYASLKRSLEESQKHLFALRNRQLHARGRRRTRLLREIRQQERQIIQSRHELAQSKAVVHVSPLKGMEWFLAFTLWFFNATCWTAWFGTRTHQSSDSDANDIHPDEPVSPPDSVSGWLAERADRSPCHCRELHEDYEKWCRQHDHAPLSRYSFYARLVELGARKFRAGRNGPTMYSLPGMPDQTKEEHL